LFLLYDGLVTADIRCAYMYSRADSDPDTRQRAFQLKMLIPKESFVKNHDQTTYLRFKRTFD